MRAGALQSRDSSHAFHPRRCQMDAGHKECDWHDVFDVTLFRRYHAKLKLVVSHSHYPGGP